MSADAAPLDAFRVVNDPVRITEAHRFDEHHQVVIGMRGTEDLFTALRVNCHPSAARQGRPVYNDRCLVHSSIVRAAPQLGIPVARRAGDPIASAAHVGPHSARGS